MIHPKTKLIKQWTFIRKEKTDIYRLYVDEGEKYYCHDLHQSAHDIEEEITPMTKYQALCWLKGWAEDENEDVDKLVKEFF